MIDEKYYNVTKDEVGKTDFWTNRLYNKAYEIVKDRKFPIVIPSYNRPCNLFLKWVDETFTNDETWPIYIVVRESQKNDYLESPYVKGKDYIHIQAFEDERINDIGKVRKAIVEHFSQTEKCVFMFDDDITNFAYTVPFKREKTGTKISFTYKPESSARVFAMWQLGMEKAISLRDDVIISCAMIAGFNWIDQFCDEAEGLRFMSGPQTLAVCINLETFKKLNINYRTIRGNGHDDIDLLIRAIMAGATTAEFRWLSYCSPGIGTDILDFSSVEQRFTQQYNEMYANFKDVEFVKWKHAKNGKAFDNVGINWRRAINYHNENVENVAPLNDRVFSLVKELNI